MKTEDKAKFLQVLLAVYDFYGKELSEFSGHVWMQAVDGCDIQQATKALSAHLMDPDRGQFMPKPADIVRQLHGTHADRSLVAWGKVREAMGRVGGYESVAFDDPAIHSAIEDIGGWTALCASTVDELPYTQKRFCDSHRAYSTRGGVHPPYLVGAHEVANRTAGRAVRPPLLIGDRDKAKEVISTGSVRRQQITQMQVPRIAA